MCIRDRCNPPVYISKKQNNILVTSEVFRPVGRNVGLYEKFKECQIWGHKFKIPYSVYSHVLRVEKFDESYLYYSWMYHPHLQDLADKFMYIRHLRYVHLVEH